MVVIIDSIVKYLTGPEISKKNYIKIKANPDVTTEDIFDYIKPSILKKPDFLLVHLGTNELTNGINTMNKNRKVAATVEEMDNERKLSWVFLQLLVGTMLINLMKY